MAINRPNARIARIAAPSKGETNGPSVVWAGGRGRAGIVSAGPEEGRPQRSYAFWQPCCVAINTLLGRTETMRDVKRPCPQGARTGRKSRPLAL